MLRQSLLIEYSAFRPATKTARHSGFPVCGEACVFARAKTLTTLSEEEAS